MFIFQQKVTSQKAAVHQATRHEGNNSLRERRNIFVSGRDPQGIFFIILT